MTDRYCIRGCTHRGDHYAECASYGKEDGPCKGCVPRTARDMALVCERCYRAMRRLLDDAPDLLAHIRGKADPLKATVFDKILVSGTITPGDGGDNVLEASNDIMVTLRALALHVQFPGQGWRAQGAEPGMTAAEAFEDARGCADLILDDLDALVNTRMVESMAVAILDHSEGFWSIARAAATWPLEDRERWAAEACPDCQTRSVRVTPPRRAGGPARYVCTACTWEADSDDDRGLWSVVMDETYVMPHEPRWLTLREAAILAGRTTGTIRRWHDAGKVQGDMGRYWKPDIEALGLATVHVNGSTT